MQLYFLMEKGIPLISHRYKIILSHNALLIIQSGFQ